MKYCVKCGKQINDNALACPYCGFTAANISMAESPTYANLALLFGALGGWLGLFFGIKGLRSYTNYTYLRKCKIGIGLFCGWIVFYLFWIILLIVVIFK